MKKLFQVLIIIAAAAMMLGCSAERYGAALDNKAQNLKVKDVLLDSSLIGKVVTLKGKISSQCGSNGCWFVLQDDTGQIFINLAPNNMAIPPRMNKTAKVTGVIYPVQGELQIIAQGVEVR